MRMIPLFQKQRGDIWLSLLASIGYLFAGLLLLALGYFIFCEARKAYWDHQVKQMCEKDGGAIVYQKISLSPEEFSKMKNAFGDLTIPSKTTVKSHSIIVSDTKDTYLKQYNPVVRRSEFSLIRNDGIVLAKQVIYSRVGGDFPSPAHESSFSCLDVAKQIAKKFDVERLTVELPGVNK
jgi:hypothetical protein